MGRAVSKPDFRQWTFSPSRTKLSRLYHRLSNFYELVQGSRHRLERYSEFAVITVLEDDLLSLLEECEEYIIGGQGLRPHQIQAFETRSLTVLEEIDSLYFLREHDLQEACKQYDHLSWS